MNTMVMMRAAAEENQAFGGLSVAEWGPAPLVIFTAGAGAATVVSAALATGQAWLGATPTVWRLAYPRQDDHCQKGETAATAGLRQQLTLLCAAVAAERGVVTRGRNGNGSTGAALPLWLVLDLASSGAAMAQGLQMLQMMDVVAWQRLQVAVRPQVLLLVKAGDQRALDDCRQRLAVMAPEPYWVVGAAANQQTATIAAALFWGCGPTTVQPAAFPPSPVHHYAVGASAYPLPVAQLQQTVALWGLLAALRDCAMQVAAAAGQADASATPAPAISIQAQQLLAEGATLTATIPGPVAVAWGRGRPRWWRCALAPARTLLAQRQIEQGALSKAQRKARQQWLTTQLTTWGQAWQRFIQTMLTSGRAEAKVPAAVGAYETTLQRLWDEVLAQAQWIDETLAEHAAATTRTQAALQASSAAVDECCRAVPTLSFVGCWQWWTTPWQWGRWLWTLLVRLPRRVHALARAVAICETALYTEANTQLVRQLALAILQDVQLQRAWLPTLRSHLQAAISVAEAQLTEGLATLPTPWTPDLVAALWQRLAATGQGDQAGRLALDGWLQPGAAEEWAASGPEGMVTTVTAAFAESSQGLAQWSAGEWLTAMFPQPDQPGRMGVEAQATLCHWLDGLADGAQPHWPTATTRVGWRRKPDVTEDGWLCLPTGCADGDAASRDGQAGTSLDIEGYLQRAQQEEGVNTWLKSRSGVRCGWQRGDHALPVILLLRRRALA